MDPSNCWPRRSTLKPPLGPGQHPNAAPRGLLFEIENQVAVVVDHDTAYALTSPPQRLPNQFWKGKSIRYLNTGTKLEQTLYKELERLRRKAYKLYEERDRLEPPLPGAELLFIMDDKVHFLANNKAWKLPQVQGKSKPVELPPHFWKHKSLKYFDRADNIRLYKVWNEKCERCRPQKRGAKRRKLK